MTFLAQDPNVIPVTQPTLPDFERLMSSFKEILISKNITEGLYTNKLKDAISQYLNVPYVATCPSGSLGLIILLSILPPGSEVIMPAFTFSATYQAIKWNSLTPILVDVGEDCNINVELVKDKISDRTSAVLAVHMFGTPPQIDELTTICKKHNIKLFFDAAHAFGSRYKGKRVGGFGDAEVFSFGPTKTLPVGEGGCITTTDENIYKSVYKALHHGQIPGTLDCDRMSINGRLPEWCAAVGVEVLKDVEINLEKRQYFANRYRQLLKDIMGINLIKVPEYAFTTYKDFAIFINEKEFGMRRDELLHFLDDKKIQTKRYYYPTINKLTIAQEEFTGQTFPVSEKLAKTTLSIPFYSHMTEAQQDYVVEKIKEAQTLCQNH